MVWASIAGTHNCSFGPGARPAEETNPRNLRRGSNLCPAHTAYDNQFTMLSWVGAQQARSVLEAGDGESLARSRS